MNLSVFAQNCTNGRDNESHSTQPYPGPLPSGSVVPNLSPHFSAMGDDSPVRLCLSSNKLSVPLGDTSSWFHSFLYKQIQVKWAFLSVLR